MVKVIIKNNPWGHLHKSREPRVSCLNPGKPSRDLLQHVSRPDSPTMAREQWRAPPRHSHGDPTSGLLLASEQIANIRKITFSASSSTSVENVESQTIVVYPNPTQDILYIKGIESQPLRVYDLQGRVLQVGNGNQMTVSNLSSGTYLLQIGIQVVRFIKQ